MLTMYFERLTKEYFLANIIHFSNNTNFFVHLSYIFILSSINYAHSPKNRAAKNNLSFIG